jgi:hypothetical protein
MFNEGCEFYRQCEGCMGCTHSKEGQGVVTWRVQLRRQNVGKQGISETLGKAALAKNMNVRSPCVFIAHDARAQTGRGVLECLVPKFQKACPKPAKRAVPNKRAPLSI